MSTHCRGSGRAGKCARTFEIGLGWDAGAGDSSWKSPKLVAELSILGRRGAAEGSSPLHWRTAAVGERGAASWTSEEQTGTDQFAGLSLCGWSEAKNGIPGQVALCWAGLLGRAKRNWQLHRFKDKSTLFGKLLNMPTHAFCSCFFPNGRSSSDVLPWRGKWGAASVCSQSGKKISTPS